MALSDVYRELGAPMLAGHAENKGGGYDTEPCIEEMCSYMARDCFTVASHMRTAARPGVDVYDPRPRPNRSSEPQLATGIDFDLFSGS